MDKVVIAALITSIAVILSAILPILKDYILELLYRGKRNWSGSYSGKGYSRETDTTYSITVTLKQRGRTVSGMLTTVEPEKLQYRIKGEIEDSEFMTLRATNTSKSTLNYVVGIVRFDRGAKQLRGEYLARSRIVEGISSGTLKLERVD